MSNERRCVFHQMREQAERAAADKAVCEMTRSLHMALAELHADAAWQAQLLMRHDSPDALTCEFVDKRWPRHEHLQQTSTAHSAAA